MVYVYRTTCQKWPQNGVDSPQPPFTARCASTWRRDAPKVDVVSRVSTGQCHCDRDTYSGLAVHETEQTDTFVTQHPWSRNARLRQPCCADVHDWHNAQTICDSLSLLLWRKLHHMSMLTALSYTLATVTCVVWHKAVIGSSRQLINS